MRLHRSVLARVCLAVSLFALSAGAQTDTATISGRVSDPQGMAVAGAKVTAVKVETNVSYLAQTNEAGFYNIIGLPTGTYRLLVEKEGFAQIVKPDVQLHVQDNAGINFSMQVGSVTQSVTVEGGAPLVNTQDAAVSTVVDRNFAENLPLNGRSFQTLIALTPGVVLTPSSSSTEQGQFTVNGQRADANYFTVDGVSANSGASPAVPSMGQSTAGTIASLSAQGGTNTLVSVDAMQEFRIQTSSFAPEFGRTPGGQVSIVTRSGTDQFHGTAFEYFRNDLLDANDWFSNYNGLPKSKDRQNDFGGVLGGPLLKDRTFFFFSYEGLRLRQPRTGQTIVPSISVRQMAPSAIQPFLNAFSKPSGPEFTTPCNPATDPTCPPSGQQPTGLAPFNSGFSNPSSLDAYSIRVDHNINPRANLFGRYNIAPSQVASRSITSLAQIDVLRVDTQTLTMGLTNILATNINNEFRVNYSYSKSNTVHQLDNFGGAVVPPDSVIFLPSFSSASGLFNFIDGFSGKTQWAIGKNGVGEQRQINVVDNLSVTAGAHQLKVGVDYRWLAPIVSPYSYLQLAQFSGTSGILSGAAAFAQVQAARNNTLLFRNLSVYAQDSFRIKPRLTLTYGLRWDINPPLKGKSASDDPFTVQGLNNPATMTLAPRGTPLYTTTYGNVAPRLGVAYQVIQRPKWITVLRGGFGVFYDLGAGTLGNVTSGFPYTATNTFSNVPFPLTPQQAAPPAVSTNPPVSSVLNIADHDLTLPRTYEWNVALEQAVGSTQTLTATYVGAVGRDLLRPYLLFPRFLSNPVFTGTVFVTTNTGTSDYHALQAQYKRRLSHGLQVLASYNLSHSIDNASSDSTLSNAPSAINTNVDRGNSSFDVRHTFASAITYEIPMPGQAKALRSMFGGWSLDTFLIARSAPPVDLTGAVRFVGGTVVIARPDTAPGQPFYVYGANCATVLQGLKEVLPGQGCPGGKALNPGAFVRPAATQGTLGRNVLRGFGAWQADLAVRRQVHVTERMNVQFRAEFFNIFNHPNFGSSSIHPSIGDPRFGLATQTLAQSLGTGGQSGGFNPLYQVGGPRSIQLALKAQF